MKNRVRMTEALVETVECVCSVTRRWRSKQIQQTIVSALVLVKLDLRLMLTPVKGFFLHTSRSAYGGMRWSTTEHPIPADCRKDSEIEERREDRLR